MPICSVLYSALKQSVFSCEIAAKEQCSEIHIECNHLNRYYISKVNLSAGTVCMVHLAEHSTIFMIL